MTPTIAQSIEALRSRHGFVAGAPATAEELDSVEQTLGRPLPESMREFLFCCNGLRNATAQFEFTSSESILSLTAAFEAWPFFRDLGLLLAMDANDSNPLCVVSQGPLAGMVAHVFHDGDSCLRFRSLGDLLAAFAAAESVVGAYDSKELRTLPPAQMTPELTEIYESLLRTQYAHEDPDGISLLMCFAIDLCADSEVARIASLLESGDEYVRERALRRLSAIDSQEARTVVHADKQAFEEFKECLLRRGTPDRVRRLNLPMLFARRHDSDFGDWIDRLLG